MNKKEFAKWASENVIYLDGATGSNLMKSGMCSGDCPETWILSHPEALIKLQESYVEAGSDVVYAPTFTSNRIKLKEYGLENQLVEITQKLVSLSKKATKGKAFVAGDITMTGKSLKPLGNMEFEDLINIYKEQIEALVLSGVDLLAIETMMSLQETRAALIAAKESCELPVICTLTFEADGRTLYGTDAKTAAVVLSSLGADAIGVNCSTGPADMLPIIKDIALVTSIPIIAKPNAGLPKIDDNQKTYYSMNADTFSDEMLLLYQAGATILGGCCGTDAEYINKIKEKIGKKINKELDNKETKTRYLSSERKTISFTLDDPFFVVGERINPTGKKKLQEALKANDMELVKAFAEEQEECGAKILDINVGMGCIDEKKVMLQVLEEVSTVTNLPLSIDSSNVEVLEAALRNYPGRALVNSVSLEKTKFEVLLPIVKKYGAMFILLPLSDQGLPANIEEKKSIIKAIEKRAFELGFVKEDIIVDGLVNTVGANKKAAIDAIETIKFCKDNGYATICGLSNISFGLPERSYVNSAFLTMAIANGLSMAIANPAQELLMCAAMASNLLLNKQDADVEYITYTEKVKEKQINREQNVIKKEVTSIPQKADISNELKFQDEISNSIYKAVLKGNKSGIVKLTKEAISSGKEPKDILDSVLMPAIQTVGEYFEKGKYFLPQLMSGAEAMKNAIEYLEPLLKTENNSSDMPVIIIATVKGDIHDIGKNLVALMLKNYGFKVIDLGKDVCKEAIIKAAKDNNAAIIALSALMTTTMKQMAEVVNYAKEQNITAKIIVGGAVVTKDYADKIGADGYSTDAQDAVKLASQLMEQMKVEG